MKPFLVLAALATLGTIVRADVDITRDQATSIKTYDIPELQSKSELIEGQIVRIKFNYRLRKVVDEKNGFSSAQIGIYRTDSRAGRSGYQYGYLKVKVPTAALPWFLKISTDDMTRQTIIVIARVEKGDGQSESRYTDNTLVELLGREIKTDTKGSHIVW